MSWVMSTTRDGGDITVWIGAVKIANLHLMKSTKGFKTYVRFMDNTATDGEYESVSAALKEIHRLLNNPPPESH